MRKNRYWGHDIAPADCQYKIKCPHLSSIQFASFVRDIQRDGIYYNHDKKTQEIIMAFESKRSRDLHADLLELNAKLAGHSIKSNIPVKQDVKQFFTPQKK